MRAFEDMNPRDGLSEMLVSVNAKTPGELQKDNPAPQDNPEEVTP